MRKRINCNYYCSFKARQIVFSLIFCLFYYVIKHEFSFFILKMLQITGACFDFAILLVTGVFPRL